MIKVNFDRPFHVTSLDLILFSKKIQHEQQRRHTSKNEMEFNFVVFLLSDFHRFIFLLCIIISQREIFVHDQPSKK
jgi:heme/copper-type cytochrome/quinol oxidase subunit 3